MPDWTVLDLPHVDEVARSAARGVSNKHRDRAVTLLAEYDDLYQEARIILATKLSQRARDIPPGQLRHELYMDLLNVVGTPKRKLGGNTVLDFALWDGKSELSRWNRPRGPLAREFPSEGLSGWNMNRSLGILRAVPVR